MNEIKNQIEAILFAAGKKVTYETIARLCNLSIATVKDNLHLLKREYDERTSPLFLTEEPDGWKITVREKYLGIVHKLMPDTELSKTVLETLAVIAWKQPALQSEIIHIRTTKAYDHIQELEDKGFVVRERKGRSYLLKATHTFYEYFDLPGKEALKQLFKDVQGQEGQRHVDDYEQAQQLENYTVEEEKEPNPKEIVDTLEKYEDNEQTPSQQEEEKKQTTKEETRENRTDEGLAIKKQVTPFHHTPQTNDAVMNEEEQEEISESQPEVKETQEEQKKERTLSPELEEFIDEDA